ncbi:ribonucleoside-diphosphate reductase beta chain [Methylomarinovum caldicuralii]|uniref:Ribonucleoside-diphosphate reductase subunit beta n=1 Tax=Methylomarinovum caldicuralii TaxID=438856 RepID=A0AAU9CY29_9GAMM|nr:ribonucleotide-diphosphate reductase subunit beta [Methylomarinovum caldicuralii]BCX82942.1 ribonucleoside-diphosphate reductase beta chain [Methylomarinovum caldicuralii]
MLNWDDPLEQIKQRKQPTADTKVHFEPVAADREAAAAVDGEKRLVGGSDLTANIAPIKYHWAWDAYIKSQRNFWLPTEIGMGEDLMTLGKLNDNERHTFFTTFATLTTADALHQRNLALAVYERITAPEVGMAVIAQMHQETIHSMSYQHIIESLNFDEDEIYLLYQKVPQIRAKFEYSNAQTHALQGQGGDLTDYVRGLFFYYMIFEGVWFMANFCPIFSLQRRRLMVRTGEQLQYIARDESGHVAFGKALIQALWREHPETRIDESQAHKLMGEAMELEQAYAEYAVKPMLGYDLELHLRHVRYLANRRLLDLGLTPLYPESEAEVLPWWEEQIGFRKEKNFFETRVTEYQTGGALSWD